MKLLIISIPLLLLVGCCFGQSFTVYRLDEVAARTNNSPSVTLAWHPSPDGTGTMLYWSAGTNQWSVDAGTNTQATISNLNMGTVYFIRARSYDSNGNFSDPGNLVVARVRGTL